MREMTLQQLSNEQGPYIEELRSGDGAFIVRQAFSRQFMDQMDLCLGNLVDQHGRPHEPRSVRVWDFYSKLATENPSIWIKYFPLSVISEICRFWFGPQFRLSAQLNLLQPQYRGSWIHRDYPVGLLTPAQIRRTPAPILNGLQNLSLQFLIAHSDADQNSGALKLIKGSQKNAYSFSDPFNGSNINESDFEKRKVFAELRKGDLLVYNPHVLHCAGNMANATERYAVLVQATYPFLVPMETIDFTSIQASLLPLLKLQYQNGKLNKRELLNAIQAAFDPIPFPICLDNVAILSKGNHNPGWLNQYEKILAETSKTIEAPESDEHF